MSYATLSVLLAGGMAGITTDLILYPLDTLKTLRQVRKSGGAQAPRLPQTFYRGLLTQMVGSFPCSAMFWIIYERVLMECTRPGLSTLQALAPGIASTVGECAVCTLRNPFDVVKQQLQAGMHKSTAQALANILREEGVRGLYAGYQSAREWRRGITTLLGMDVLLAPLPSLYFPTYPSSNIHSAPPLTQLFAQMFLSYPGPALCCHSVHCL